MQRHFIIVFTQLTVVSCMYSGDHDTLIEGNLMLIGDFIDLDELPNRLTTPECLLNFMDVFGFNNKKLMLFSIKIKRQLFLHFLYL